MIRPTLLSLLISTLLVPATHAAGTGTTGTGLDRVITSDEKKATTEANALAERERKARQGIEAENKELKRQLAAEADKRKAAEAASEEVRRRAIAADVAAKKQAAQQAAEQTQRNAAAQARIKREKDDAKAEKAEAKAAAIAAKSKRAQELASEAEGEAKRIAQTEQAQRDAAARQPTAGQVIQDDCPDCPKMVVIPAGNFIMGSPDNEVERDPEEGPQHPVRVESFLMGQTEVTNAQFRRFTQATGYQTEVERKVGDRGCWASDPASDASIEYKKWDWYAWSSWRKPGWDVKDNEPVACMSWNDAKAYVDWLSQLTHKTYQLPTEAQWEYAARAVTSRVASSPSSYWGDDPNQACLYANAADQTTSPNGSGTWGRHECKDGYWFVAPVAHYKPNAFGLYDMLGNQWEWTADCFNSGEYQRRKTDGEWLASKTSEEISDCSRVMRGGSWYGGHSGKLRSARRLYFKGFTYINSFNGFRVVRTAP